MANEALLRATELFAGRNSTAKPGRALQLRRHSNAWDKDDGYYVEHFSVHAGDYTTFWTAFGRNRRTG